jgi:ribosome biogenesis GTPase
VVSFFFPVWHLNTLYGGNTLVPSREDKQWQHHEENKRMRQVRKQIKRNRKTKRARRKDWIPDSFDDLDDLYDLDAPEQERVMPRGERERRQTLMEEALAALREEMEQKEQATAKDVSADSSNQYGIVIEVSSSLCRVELDGHILICGVRGSLSAEDTGYTNVIAVGDNVVISQNGADRGIVEAVLPRQSILARPDVFHNHLQQVIVANAEQLLVVASWRDPKLWPELIDRYLIAAERHGLSPIICVNKVDLAQDIGLCRKALHPYLDLGYQVLFTSALTGKGTSKLKDVLKGCTTVLAGMSGVGKSSLLNAVQEGLHLRTAEVSDWSHTGRHTTSQINLLKLEIGGYVVDTPGIREFGLSNLRRGELIRFYPEIAAVEGRCRFSDCSHTHEPGCEVKAAVQQGGISKMRFSSYQQIYRALPKSQSQERAQAQARAWR